jgi:hypothetical protein
VTLAIIRLTAEDTWLGANVSYPTGPDWFGSQGHPRAYGQIVALAPKDGHVWVCDGVTFHEVPVEQLARGWEQEPLI